MCYRKLWEKQALDTSCPQFVCPGEISEVVNGRKDSGSHSGSDSGMGFSETASEHNLPAVMPTENDIIISDVMTDDIAAKRSSKAMDPKMYLEASYIQDESDRILNPLDYLSQSTVITDPPTTLVPESSEVYQNKPGPSQHYPSKPSSSKDHPSKSLKKHYWEILEEPASIPQSPEGIQYAPSPRISRADQRRSSFRDSRRSFNLMEEPMNVDPNIPLQNADLPIMDPGVPKHPSDDDLHLKRSGSEVI